MNRRMALAEAKIIMREAHRMAGGPRYGRVSPAMHAAMKGVRRAWFDQIMGGSYTGCSRLATRGVLVEYCPFPQAPPLLWPKREKRAKRKFPPRPLPSPCRGCGQGTRAKKRLCLPCVQKRARLRDREALAMTMSGMRLREIGERFGISTDRVSKMVEDGSRRFFRTNVEELWSLKEITPANQGDQLMPEGREERMFGNRSQVARRYGMTKQAVYSWVKKGLVPESVMRREGGKLLLDCDALDSLIRDGKLFRRPQKRFRPHSGLLAVANA